MDAQKRSESSDWYRRSTWTSDDKCEFFKRLKRSRSDHTRSQYLRIQAITLTNNGYARDAITLLNQLLEEHPDDYHRGLSHTCRAEALAYLGDTDSAIDDYRTALDLEKGDCPNVHTTAWCDLPWLIVQCDREDLYDEAIRVLDYGESQQSSTLPITRYIDNAVRAVIADRRGDHKAALDHASRALSEASRDYSGLSHHPTVGLVSEARKESSIHKTLFRIARE